MSTLFTINFRREAYRRQLAHARRRVLMLGGWVAYFGVVGIVLGLYALNGLGLAGRVRRIERQTTQFMQTKDKHDRWEVAPAELATVERLVINPVRWRDRLTRLGALLPPDARIVSLAANPDDRASAEERNRLVIAGELRLSANQERMGGIMQLVSALRADSLFSAGYANIRLASTRIVEGPGSTTQFVIECQ
ncbi:MAG: hypothetical protein A2W00_05420 [Candidatus Eisenbacteria bacterium RBG_16_71_46]|nr:MAG: hypothetical protein A2W00_05420 [Candidatus Eisenbacteria bacterium RBG_16_71_46]OGF23989.1 MAG: hypothetical protein A2V63_03895 [Candidatus Eisenbacteria bacterium RBG_19FT_COMBO_70_11]